MTKKVRLIDENEYFTASERMSMMEKNEITFRGYVMIRRCCRTRGYAIFGTFSAANTFLWSLWC